MICSKSPFPTADDDDAVTSMMWSMVEVSSASSVRTEKSINVQSINTHPDSRTRTSRTATHSNNKADSLVQWRGRPPEVSCIRNNFTPISLNLDFLTNTKQFLTPPLVTIKRCKNTTQLKCKIPKLFLHLWSNMATTSKRRQTRINIGF